MSHHLESKSKKTMKRKHLFLAIASLLAASGLWFARSAWRGEVFQKSSVGVGVETPHDRPKPGQMLRPPDPIRRFRELTPEQRVRQARQPQGG
jgi:hypothetical protein